MKKDIHPTYYPQANVTCVCGSTFSVGSTLDHIEVEICSACHPFYTGADKVIDTAGRVERFRTRLSAAKPLVVAQKKAKRVIKQESKKKEMVNKTLIKKTSKSSNEHGTEGESAL